jgi:hypothetical protein
MTEIKIGDLLPYRGDQSDKWLINAIRKGAGIVWVNASKEGKCQWFPSDVFKITPKLMSVNVMVWDSYTRETSDYAFKFKSPSIKLPGSDHTVVFYGAIAKLVHECTCMAGDDEHPDDWIVESNTRITDSSIFAVYKSKTNPEIVTTYYIWIESVGA